MCKCQCVARLEVGLYNFLVDVSLLLIRNQHHDDIALSSCLCGGLNGQTSSLSLSDVLGARTQTNNDLNARVVQVHCMCMTLRAEAQNGNGLAVEYGQIAVCIIIHLYHGCFLLKSIYR